MAKVCSKCNTLKKYSQFHKCKKMTDGYKSACKACRKLSASKRYTKNKVKINKKNKEYYDNNKDTLSVTRRNYYVKNRDHLTEKAREWARNNRDKKSVYKIKRRSIEGKACPKWSELSKIKEVYDGAVRLSNLTGLKYHVDHIVPLNNSNVCGLHVWANLQILCEEDNLKKGNIYNGKR